MLNPMSVANALRLLLLSAIWGGSFLFMRIGAAPLGPTLLITLRVALAAAFLFVVGAALGKRLRLAANWRHYLILGLLNAALPFLLLAYAAQFISASLLSILNATAPMWSALVGWIWRRTRIARVSAAGLVMGLSGVIMLTGVESLTLDSNGSRAMLAALGAALCYGIATTYARSAPAIDAFANAHGTMWAATLLVLPTMATVRDVPPYDVTVWASVAGLGILCSGVAYLIYFRLVAEIGATGALTVTFIVPAFGMLWGHLFLGERLGWHAILSALVILAGTALANGVLPKRFARR
jgi:drug/metabolite transporter (DMT)-like permease